MEIYIEEFLIQNILINLCLLKLIEITTKCKTSFFKLFLASIVGSCFSVAVVYFLNKLLIVNILKFMCALIMLSIAYKQGKKQLIFNLILLFIYTYAFGGAVSSLISTTYVTNFGIITNTKVNLNIICLIILIITYLFQFIAKNIKFKLKTNNLIYKLKLFKNNRNISVNAYLDTGNFLNINGKAVIIVDLDSYLKLTKSNLIDFYLTKTEQIKTGTVTGNSNLKVFLLDKVEIEINNKTQILTNQYIAVNTNPSFKNANYQALLSPLIL